MTCPFYEWKSNFFGGDYYCRKKQAEVNTDLYQKYCRDYNYGECPIYKGNSDSSSCYLTTACLVANQVDPHCYELDTLRSFRDNYLKSTQEGQKLIDEYYSIAPRIVSEINDLVEGKKIYNNIYHEVIIPCVGFIENGQNEKAKNLYCQMVLHLKEMVLN